MGKNFVEAQTEIDDLVSQKNEIMVKISNNVAAAVLDRARGGNLKGIGRDIDNLLKDLSDEEKYRVMVSATVAIAKNRAASSSSNSSSGRDSLFSRF